MARRLGKALSVGFVLTGLVTGAVASPSGGEGGAGGVCEPAAQRDMQAALDQAIETIARQKGEDTARRRSLLLAAIAGSHACYAGNLSDEELLAILQRTQALPPALDTRGVRFETETLCWLGEGTITAAGSSRRASLTYSFPADGVSWGSACGGINTILPNALGARLTASFGSLDRGREYVRSALAVYRRAGGLRYREVADDGTPMDMSPTRSSTRGDIRIGGIPLGSPSFSPLAYNAFPQGQSVSSCAGGDMVINTDAFGSVYLGATPGDMLYFRNCVAHEHGHGLGLLHTVPCNRLKLMEPFIYNDRALLGNDDIRGVQRNYGDRYAGNNSSDTPAELGNLTTPILRSVIERDLSTNGTEVTINGLVTSTDDWFRFTLSSQQNVTITVSPTGATVTAGTVCGSPSSSSDPAACVGRQTSSCQGTVGLVNARQAGNLSVEVRDSTTVNSLGFAGSGGPGVDEVLALTLPAGTYLLRVRDSGGTTSSNQLLQTYDLTVRVGTALAPPVAIAGLDKLATAGQLTQFIGNHNSRATETGASIPTGNYAWDLDGDGTFETTSNPQPTITYVSNGTYPVALRVTDSNSRSATDTIQVTVRGATTSLTGCAPSTLGRGLSTPVVITGTNLKGVTSASQITVSGAGVTVSGTPVVDAMGTRITGLSLAVAANAATGPRSVTVTNADALGIGSNATAAQLVTVAAPPSNDECSAASPLGSALGSVAFSTAGASTSSSTPCPATMRSDVWYSWTAPASGMLTVAPDTTFGVTLAGYAGSACPPGVAQSCSSSDSITLNVTAGETYLFRVGADDSLVTGAGNLVLNLGGAGGACCAADGSCTITSAGSCGGTFNGAAACSPNPCPQPTVACCAPSGACTTATSAACSTSGGTPQGQGSTCSPSPCPQPAVACCAASGACTSLTATACASSGGTAQAFPSSCSPNPCPQPSIACCFADGSCTSVSASSCAGSGGSAQAFPSSCSPSPCPLPSVPCCRGATCSLLVSVQCVSPGPGVGAQPLGSGTCNAPGVASAPCCHADFDKQGGRTIDDIFLFLNAWFAASPYASIQSNGAAAPNIDDIFIFLNAWFAGCN